jgi:sec-independent protein translocase protein TatB
MDGFFGIGIQELVLIAIVALIVLGPERLPATLREVAKFIRYVRNLTRDFTEQFGDDFKALEDLNPRRILQQAITSIDEEEEAKEDPKKAKATPAKATTTATSKSAVKPTPAKATTPKTTTPAKSVATTPAQSTTPATKTAGSTATDQSADKAPTTATIPESMADAPSLSPAETENRIAPPAVINATQAPAEPAANTVVYSSHTNGMSNEGAKTISAPPTSEVLTPVSVVTNSTQDHPVTQPD